MMKMSGIYEVEIVLYDNDPFSRYYGIYAAPEGITVAVFVDRAMAKSIARHYIKQFRSDRFNNDVLREVYVRQLAWDELGRWSWVDETQEWASRSMDYFKRKDDNIPFWA